MRMSIEIKVEQLGLPSQEYLLERLEFVVGCHPFNAVVIIAEGVGAKHGKFFWLEGALRYEGLGARHRSTHQRAGKSKSVSAEGVTLKVNDQILLGISEKVRITILDFGGAFFIEDEFFGMPTETPCRLIQTLKPFLKQIAMEGMNKLLLSQCLQEGSTHLQALIEQLLPDARVSLVLPEGEQRFLNRVISAHPEEQGGFASPDSRRMRSFLMGNRRVAILSEESNTIDLLVPMWREPFSSESPESYLQISLAERPSLEAVEGLLQLVVFFQPGITALVRLDAAERDQAALREENRYFRERFRRHYNFKSMVYRSEAMQRLHQALMGLLQQSDPVLVTGEAGCGKQLVARAIHHLGPRAPKMFIAQNCGALGEEALDLELFGLWTPDIEDTSVKGLFELAEGGTIFLGEIDRLPIVLQDKLIRMFHEREIRRKSESAGRSVDVRVIASSHRSLPSLVRSGEFRRDLFTLLAGASLSIPPLRERSEDVLALAQHFLGVYNLRYGLSVRGFEAAVEEHLVNCAWRGNVRELQVVVETAVMKANSGLVQVQHLGLNRFSS